MIVFCQHCVSGDLPTTTWSPAATSCHQRSMRCNVRKRCQQVEATDYRSMNYGTVLCSLSQLQLPRTFDVGILWLHTLCQHLGERYIQGF